MLSEYKNIYFYQDAMKINLSEKDGAKQKIILRIRTSALR